MKGIVCFCHKRAINSFVTIGPPGSKLSSKTHKGPSHIIILRYSLAQVKYYCYFESSSTGFKIGYRNSNSKLLLLTGLVPLIVPLPLSAL